jgi:hypothetical protein
MRFLWTVDQMVTAWPETLAVTTPQERHADSAVKVSEVNVATRTTPKT